MRVVVAGGHGKIARHLGRMLADRGDAVAGLIRDPAHADDLRADGSEPVLLDIESTDASTLAGQLEGADAAVFAALVVWWLIGGMTADDGYFLTMAQVRDDLGYVTDYYRWFSGTVAPMGWFVELQARWVAVSTATPWIRLPALGMGLLSWVLISRYVQPRLGQRVRRSRAAGWAAAAVFLACWL